MRVDGTAGFLKALQRAWEWEDAVMERLRVMGFESRIPEGAREIHQDFNKRMALRETLPCDLWASDGEKEIGVAVKSKRHPWRRVADFPYRLVHLGDPRSPEKVAKVYVHVSRPTGEMMWHWNDPEAFRTLTRWDTVRREEVQIDAVPISLCRDMETFGEAFA